MRRRTSPRIATLLLAGGLVAAPAAAQLPSLDRAEELIARGEYAAAREIVERWWREEPAASPDILRTGRPRALLLRARLATHAAEAERDYLALALGHPSSPEAAVALLRLGQGLLASGQAERAATYLERLATDHPNSPDRAVGLLWLARARRLAGRTDAACEAANQAAESQGVGPDLAALIRSEQVASCRRITDPRPSATRQTPPPTRTAADRPETNAGTTRTFAAQAGAFREESGAQTLAAQLRRAGFEPRLVRLPGSSLIHVRIGRFATAAEADALVARLRAAGFTALVVRDAAREEAVR
ncbi:MAG: SPOR domain-containing protein [bacterium]|jgi:cell division septation protein DedD|nr:MAG: hypothetical protein DIU52_05630 [bacterium]